MPSRENIVVDVEADGACPGLYSMVEFAAVQVTKNGLIGNKFYSGPIKPVTPISDEAALKSIGRTREDYINGEDPCVVMQSFAMWMKAFETERFIFFSDNNGFDWQFINYYFHKYVGHNPFGFSSANMNSLYKGLNRKYFTSFKHLRKTPHTHHPLDDAIGNAEALIAFGGKIEGLL